MQVELSDAELSIVCVALSFLRASYEDEANHWKVASVNDVSLAGMSEDSAASAQRLTPLLNRLAALLER